MTDTYIWPLFSCILAVLGYGLGWKDRGMKEREERAFRNLDVLTGGSVRIVEPMEPLDRTATERGLW